MSGNFRDGSDDLIERIKNTALLCLAVDMADGRSQIGRRVKTVNVLWVGHIKFKRRAIYSKYVYNEHRQYQQSPHCGNLEFLKSKMGKFIVSPS